VASQAETPADLASARRDISIVKLLSSNIAVLAYRMDGTTMCDHSPEPWRTKSALVKAAKDMMMAKMPTQIPLREASTWPATRVGAGIFGTAVVTMVVADMI
jgi:hypothetical protein